jgi:hypothetical protein
MILPSKGKIVKHTIMHTGRAAFRLGREGGSSYVELLDCNDSFVKISKPGPDAWSRSIALAGISWVTRARAAMSRVDSIFHTASIALGPSFMPAGLRRSGIHSRCRVVDYPVFKGPAAL